METGETQREPAMESAPQKEHQWLQKLVGEWTFDGEATMKPGEPSQKFSGTESVRSLGGLWILAEGHGEMPGVGASETLMTLGYDPQKKRYVGTWVGSMASFLWLYEGALDADERVLTLDTQGPDMEGQGKLVKYRDVIEFKSDDHRVLRSQILGDDGQWHVVVTCNYRRKQQVYEA